MCGIGGYIRKTDSIISSTSLINMGKALEHRGPDDLGYLVWNGVGFPEKKRSLSSDENNVVGFVHRRLSIIDLTEGGWQPMSNSNQDLHIIYNGEIYNYIELREKLINKGHIFLTNSDTEVLLAGYCEWGKDLLNYLVGMFAFAILDQKRRTVFLARDFFGIKPLYYVNLKNRFFFASEIKSLLTIEGVTRQVAIEQAYRYLRDGITNFGEDTLFSDIKQVPAACWIEISVDNLEIEGPVKYWSLPTKRLNDIDLIETRKNLRELFLESVNIHMRSDVPVGAALSGGIDSSSIVMAMRHVANKETDIHTFTYVASDKNINEEYYADIIGKSANTIMHKIHLEPNDLLGDLDDLLYSHEQPFGSTSIYAQYKVFRKAKEVGIKVMLDGQGADEMLAGYRSYLTARIASLIRRGELIAAVKLIKFCLVQHGYVLKDILKLIASIFPTNILKRILLMLDYFKYSPPWLNHKWSLKQNVLINSNFNINSLNSLDLQLHTTFMDTSLPSLLRYEDINSMVHSVESRVPFLTPAFVNYIFTLPEYLLIDYQGTTKSIFRESMRGIVPDVILDRRDKIGFQTPEFQWLTRQQEIYKILDSSYAKSIPIFNHDIMKKEYQAVMNGKRSFDWRVWRWVNFIRWSELFNVRY